MDNVLANFLQTTGWSCDDLLKKISQYKEISEKSNEQSSNETKELIKDNPERTSGRNIPCKSGNSCEDQNNEVIEANIHSMLPCDSSVLGFFPVEPTKLTNETFCDSKNTCVSETNDIIKLNNDFKDSYVSRDLNNAYLFENNGLDENQILHTNINDFIIECNEENEQPEEISDQEIVIECNEDNSKIKEIGRNPEKVTDIIKSYEDNLTYENVTIIIQSDEDNSELKEINNEKVPDIIDCDADHSELNVETINESGTATECVENNVQLQLDTLENKKEYSFQKDEINIETIQQNIVLGRNGVQECDESKLELNELDLNENNKGESESDTEHVNNSLKSQLTFLKNPRKPDDLHNVISKIVDSPNDRRNITLDGGQLIETNSDTTIESKEDCLDLNEGNKNNTSLDHQLMVTNISDSITACNENNSRLQVDKQIEKEPDFVMVYGDNLEDNDKEDDKFSKPAASAEYVRDNLKLQLEFLKNRKKRDILQGDTSGKVNSKIIHIQHNITLNGNQLNDTNIGNSLIKSKKNNPKVNDVEEENNPEDIDNEHENINESVKGIECIRNNLKLQLESLRNRRKGHILQEVTTKIGDYKIENKKLNSELLTNKKSNHKNNESTVFYQTNELGFVISGVEGGVKDIECYEHEKQYSEATLLKASDESVFAEIRKIIRKPKNTTNLKKGENVPIPTNNLDNIEIQSESDISNDSSNEPNKSNRQTNIIFDSTSLQSQSNSGNVLTGQRETIRSPFVSNELDRLLSANSQLKIIYNVPKSGVEAGLRNDNSAKSPKLITQNFKKSGDKSENVKQTGIIVNPPSLKCQTNSGNVLTEESKTIQSPFVSNELDQFLSANSQLQISYNVPTSGAEAGLRNDNRAESPKLINHNLKKFRTKSVDVKESEAGLFPKIKAKTLAEKRRLLQQSSTDKQVDDEPAEIIQVIFEDDVSEKQKTKILSQKNILKIKNKIVIDIKEKSSDIINDITAKCNSKKKINNTLSPPKNLIKIKKKKILTEVKEKTSFEKNNREKKNTKPHSKNKLKAKIKNAFMNINEATVNNQTQSIPQGHVNNNSLLKINYDKKYNEVVNIRPSEKEAYVLYNNEKVFVTCSTEGLICKIEGTLDQQKSFIEAKPINPTKLLVPTIPIKLKKKLWCDLSSNRIKCKPGPLSKKCKLVLSQQGDVQLLVKKLPIPILEILPEFRKPIAPEIIHLMPKNDGKISEFQIEFALTALMPIRKERPDITIYGIQLPYKHKEKSILVQKIVHPPTLINDIDSDRNNVKSVINDLITYLEIKELEPSLSKEDPDDVPATKELDYVFDSASKTILKRPKKCRVYLELSRLNCKVVDVASEDKTELSVCNNSYCKMGCVCQSLKSDFPLNIHCRKMECLFGCQCPKNETIPTSGSMELSKDVVTQIEERTKKHLAKVEKDFTHTVIRTGHEAIVVGAVDKSKRVTRAPKKYEDFVYDCANENIFSSFTKETKKSNCTVVTDRLHLPGVIPWCMDHVKYDCPCLRSEAKVDRHLSSIEHCARLESAHSYIQRNKNVSYYCELMEKIKKLNKRFPENDKKILFYTNEHPEPPITDAELLKSTLQGMGAETNDSTNSEDPNKVLEERIIKRKQNFDDLDSKYIQRRKKPNLGVGGSSLLIPKSVFKHKEKLVEKKYNELLKHIDPKDTGSVRLLSWNFLLNLYTTGKVILWSVPPRFNKLFLNNANKNIPKDGVNIRNKLPDIEICRWLVEGTLPPNQNPNTTALVIKECVNYFEIRGICAKRTRDPNTDAFKSNELVCPNDTKFGSESSKQSSHLKKKKCEKLMHKTKDGIVKQINLSLFNLPMQKWNFADNLLQYQLPAIANEYKWRTFLLNSNFTYLSFTRNNYSIRYRTLETLSERSFKEKKTIFLTNSELASKYNNPGFGIYITPTSEKIIFVGPYSKHESHDTETLRYISQCLIDTKSYNKMQGKNTSGANGFWITNHVKNENVNNICVEPPLIDLTSDDCDEESKSESRPVVSTSVNRKGLNRYLITNIPDFGYLSGVLYEDTGDFEVIWPLDNRVVKFQSTQEAKLFLQQRIYSTINPIPSTFQVEIQILPDIDLTKHRPVECKYLSGSFICGEFGILNAKELNQQDALKKCGVPLETIMLMLAKKAHSIVNKNIMEVAKMLNLKENEDMSTVLDSALIQLRGEKELEKKLLDIKGDLKKINNGLKDRRRRALSLKVNAKGPGTSKQLKYKSILKPLINVKRGQPLIKMKSILKQTTSEKPETSTETTLPSIKIVRMPEGKLRIVPSNEHETQTMTNSSSNLEILEFDENSN